MKLLVDFFPILLFYGAYQWQGIYVATAVAIAASLIQVSYLKLRHNKVEPVHLMTLAVVGLFGGATLLLQDETFIKWKPTVVNLLLAGVFLGSQYLGRAPIVQRMMEAQLELSTAIWQRLNLMWCLFFVAMAGANAYVALTFDTDTWVNFKLYGMLGLTVLFLFAQGFYLMRLLPPSKEPNSED